MQVPPLLFNRCFSDQKFVVVDNVKNVDTVSFNNCYSGMLRADKATVSFASAVTINAFFSTDNPLRMPANSFVFTASRVRSSRTMMLLSITLEDNTDLIAKRRTF